MSKGSKEEGLVSTLTIKIYENDITAHISKVAGLNVARLNRGVRALMKEYHRERNQQARKYRPKPVPNRHEIGQTKEHTDEHSAEV